MDAFTSTIQTIVQQRDAAFVAMVASDYGLPVDELMAKYNLIPGKQLTGVKVKRAQVAIASDGDGPKCTAITAKKLPCKFDALTGESLCKRHLRVSKETGEVVPTGPVCGPIKVPKPVKKAPSMHTHPADELIHDDCTHCTTFGNLLCGGPAPREEPSAPIGDRTLSQRIADILGDDSSDDDSAPALAAAPSMAAPAEPMSESDSGSESDEEDAQPEPKRAKFQLEDFSDEE
jgi:hypothetical protein